MKIEIEKTESFSALTRHKTGTEEYDLVIIGTGVGSKLVAWTLAGKGQRVGVIERVTRLLSREDPDVSEGLQNMLEKEGLSVALNTRIKAVSGTSGYAVKVKAEVNGIERAFAISR